jgi:hypothetical protein
MHEPNTCILGIHGLTCSVIRARGELGLVHLATIFTFVNLRQLRLTPHFRLFDRLSSTKYRCFLSKLRHIPEAYSSTIIMLVC